MKNQRMILFTSAVIFGWILSFPYEGPVLYALGQEYGTNSSQLNTLTVFCLFVGLFTGRYISKNLPESKRTILLSLSGTLLLSSLLPLVESDYWAFIVPGVAYLMGAALSGYAHLITAYVPLNERRIFGADILIYANIVLVLAHALATNIPPTVAFILLQLLLFTGLIQIIRIDVHKIPVPHAIEPTHKIALKKFFVFFTFIFIISINSGIMFRVIFPYFSELDNVTGLYTHLPYLIIVYLLSRVFRQNKLNFLFTGLSLWGLTFIVFSLVPPNEPSYILLCTLMLTASGIFDYYWWSVMVSNFELVDNPSSLLGQGLALHILGVWVGSLLANQMIFQGLDRLMTGYLGLSVVFISLIIVLPLNAWLSSFIEANDFMVRFSDNSKKQRLTYREEAKSLLSAREYDVFCHLIEGKTDPVISEELSISLSTTKTHNRKIYRKLQVSGRQEIIEKAGDL